MQASMDGGSLTFGGLASGLKTDEIVPALVDKSRGPMRKIEQHQEVLNAHQELLEAVQASMVELGYHAHQIDSVAKFLVQRASSTDEDVVTAVAGDGAIPGNYHLYVDELATAQRTLSTSVDDAEAELFAGWLSWRASGETQTLQVPPGTSLRELAASINRESAGMSAQVVYDGKTYRLQLDGTQTGAPAALQLEEGGLELGLTDAERTLRPARDASFRIDNQLQMTREQNIVHDAVQGVTLALEQAEAGATVRVAADLDAMVEAVNNFVAGYNVAMEAVDLASKPNRDFERGRMVGDTALRHMHQAMQQAVTKPVAGLKGPYNSISQVGVASDKDGRLRVDKARLRDCLRRAPSDVARVFGRDRRVGTEGAAASLQKVVDHYTMPMTGVLPGKLQSITRQRGSNDQHLTHMQAQLDKYEGHLRDQFSNLERTMTKMKGQKDFLDQQLKSVSHSR